MSDSKWNIKNKPKKIDEKEREAWVDNAKINTAKTKIARLSMQIPNDLHASLKRIAIDSERKMYEVVVEFLYRSIEEYEKRNV